MAPTAWWLGSSSKDIMPQSRNTARGQATAAKTQNVGIKVIGEFVPHAVANMTAGTKEIVRESVSNTKQCACNIKIVLPSAANVPETNYLLHQRDEQETIGSDSSISDFSTLFINPMLSHYIDEIPNLDEVVCTDCDPDFKRHFKVVLAAFLPDDAPGQIKLCGILKDSSDCAVKTSTCQIQTATTTTVTGFSAEQPATAYNVTATTRLPTSATTKATKVLTSPGERNTNSVPTESSTEAQPISPFVWLNQKVQPLCKKWTDNFRICITKTKDALNKSLCSSAKRYYTKPVHLWPNHNKATNIIKFTF